MTSKIRRWLLLVFVLLVVACEPAPPRHAGSAARVDPNADARWLLGADGSGCSAGLGDVLAGETKLEIADSGQGFSGVPAPDNPKLLAVREPILKELLAYAKATDKSEKEKHAQSVRELFGSISTAAALPFKAMLETDDVLAVTFRKVLKDDPFKDELLGLLDRKSAPPPAQPTPQSPAPPAQTQASTTASPGQAWARNPPVTLPSVTLTDEASFDQLHKDVKEQIDALEAAVKRIAGGDTGACKKKLEHDTVPALRDVLRTAKEGRDRAFNEPDAAERAKGLKDAGADYLGLAYATQMSLLAVNFVIVADYANEHGLGHDMLDTPYNTYVLDKGMLSLLQASLEGDAGKMTAALPAGAARFQVHLQYLDKWIVSLNQGAVLSGKVIKAANIVMIAISIYQVWKIPVVAGGGAPSPPTVVGVLPGGVAVSSGVNLTSLATSLEAIRRLVAIGALDGALVSGLTGLGGLPSASLPELQKPSFSVQGPNQGGGSSASPTAAGAVQPADLQPYNKGQGHHVPAKSLFEGAPNYDPNKALAIPKAELERLGIAHPVGRLTNAQRAEYQALAKTGKLPTWEEIAKIETDALVKGDMKPDMAQATVAKAIKALKDAGVAGPVRAPWGK